MTMEIQDRLVTRLYPESYGGMILCGMNWGGVSPNSDPVKGDWATFFADDATNSDRFQQRLKHWFSFWGHPLYPDNTPCVLDRAISQTNMFLDQSKSFNLINRTADDWKFAMETFAETVSELRASGVLLFSKTIADKTSKYAMQGVAPKWTEVIGTDLAWDQCRYGRLKLRTATGAKLPFVSLSHPNYYTANSFVEASREFMEPWISGIIQEYRKKQSGRTTP